MAVTVSLQAEGLTQMLSFLDPKTYARARRGGVRYASKSVPPAVSKGIRANYNIAAARVKDDVAAPVITDESITIRFSRRPPTWRAYGAKPAPRGGTGISYQIFKAGGRRVSRSGFFINIGPAPGLPMRRLGPGRSNITTLYGPSIGSIFAGRSKYGEEIRGPVVQRTMDQFMVGVRRELDRAARGF